jgi:hypothetical protein
VHGKTGSRRVLGHFTIRPKGRDHEIERALETHPKAYNAKFEVEARVVTGFKCSEKIYATGHSTD